MTDLERRLLDYGRELDAEVAPVGVLELAERMEPPSVTVRLQPMERGRQRRPAVALAAAAVLILALSIPFMLSRQDDRHVPFVDSGSRSGGPTTAVPQQPDACSLLLDAATVVRGGEPGRDALLVGSEAIHSTITHDDHALEPWSQDACALGWDHGLDAPHLYIRVVATSLEEAELLLDDVLDGDPSSSLEPWSYLRPHLWSARGHGPPDFHAVAVWVEERFFVVTTADSDIAMALARAVEDDLSGWECCP